MKVAKQSRNYFNSLSTRECELHGLEIKYIRLGQGFVESICDECFDEEPSMEDELITAEEARIKSMESLKKHDIIYSDYINNISQLKDSKLTVFEQEKEKMESLVSQNQQIVAKLVHSYFEELKNQWVESYFNPTKAKVIGMINNKLRLVKKKVSKVRKLRESFMNGQYDSDLLVYALEKNTEEADKVADISEIDTVEHLKMMLKESEVRIKKQAQISICSNFQRV